jgi:hypothetical protein
MLQVGNIMSFPNSVRVSDFSQNHTDGLHKYQMY